jgi:predicted RecA/RadA family phage recombinase
MSASITHYVAPGICQDYTPSGATVAKGQFIQLFSGRVGLAEQDIADGQKGALRVAGMVGIPNPDSTAFAAGATVQVANLTAANAKAVTTGGTTVGKACKAWVSGEPVYVLINDLPG